MPQFTVINNEIGTFEFQDNVVFFGNSFYYNTIGNDFYYEAFKLTEEQRSNTYEQYKIERSGK